jgi:hypothetical protein
MRAQMGINVVPIFVTPIQILLQQNNIGVTYVRTSNFKMKLIIFVPLYYVVMPQSIITITKAPFVLALLLMLVVSYPDHTLQGEQNL